MDNLKPVARDGRGAKIQSTESLEHSQKVHRNFRHYKFYRHLIVLIELEGVILRKFEFFMVVGFKLWLIEEFDSELPQMPQALKID